jgi:hypothetical protein
MEAMDLEAFARSAEVASREAVPRRLDNMVNGVGVRVGRWWREEDQGRGTRVRARV